MLDGLLVLLKGNTLPIILRYLEGDKQALLSLVSKQLWELVPQCTKSFTINSSIIGRTLIVLRKRTSFSNYLEKLRVTSLQLNFHTHRIIPLIAVHLLEMPNITTLDLALNTLNNIDNLITIQRLADAISKLLYLEKLNLGKNDMGKVAGIFIVKAIGSLSNLKILNLESNNIGPTGAEALAPSLLKMNQLEELYIGHNQISTGMDLLSESIAQLSTLEKLDCSSNKINSKHLDFNFLKELTKLISLDFMWNPLNLDGAKSLAPVLKYLSQLEKLDLRFTGITPEGVKLIDDNLPTMKLTVDMYWSN